MEVFQPEAELTPDYPTRVMLIERSILLLLVVGLLISVLAILRPFATPLLFGSAIAIAIWPVRQCLVRSGIRRGLAALLLFCLIIGIILLPMLMIAPHMAEQLSQATQRFQTFFASTPAKPVWIGFGVDMPLSLTVIGVFGGFIVFGFLGLFLGPTLLAIVYRLFMAWRAAVELHPTMGSGMRETRTHSVGQQNSGRRVGGN